MTSPTDGDVSFAALRDSSGVLGNDADTETRRRSRFRGLVEAQLAEVVTFRGRHAVVNRRILRAGLIVATVGFGLVVWFLRRPDQLLHPYVWAEEYLILNRYQAQGLFHAAIAPVQGYFVWPSTFSVSVAASTSFLHVPLLGYWASTAWFVATLCLILVPSSTIRLRWRIGLVVLLVLVPTNPEVFGNVELTFWWTTLWPLISILWSRDVWWLRIPVLIIGGMSSLAGAAVVVPYAFLFLVTRRQRYLVGTAVLAVTLLIQSVAYFTSARSARTPIHPRSVALQELHNFSYYALTWLRPTDSAFLAFAGACMLLTVVAVVAHNSLRGRAPHRHELVAVALGLLVFGILSSIPAPLVADPITAGPRYYFLPYILLGWVLLLIAVTSELHWARIAATVTIVISLFTLSLNFSRHDDLVSWSSHLAQCQHTTRAFTVPVQTDGKVADMWRGLLVITPATCRRLGYR